MIWTDGSCYQPEMGGGWVAGYGLYFLDRPECNASEFVPVSESHIGSAELLPILKDVCEVTICRQTYVMCNSEYVVNGCNGWAPQ